MNVGNMAARPITVISCEIAIKFQDDFRVPRLLGNTIRGGFGHAFKDATCALKRQHCESCILNSRCVYRYVFETPPPEESEFMRLYPSVPHPFILESTFHPDAVNSMLTESIITIRLFGKAIKELPYFIYAFTILGRLGLGEKRIPYDIVDVCALDENGKSTSIFEPEKGVLSDYSRYEVALGKSPKQYSTDLLTLNFETPVRIKENGRLLKESISFTTLLKTLLRRISAIYYFHCDQIVSKESVRDLLAMTENIQIKSSNLKWWETERYSGRQKTRMKIGGLVGSITYSGELSPFIDILHAGSVLHVGKSSSFGFGMYSIGEITQSGEE